MLKENLFETYEVKVFGLTREPSYYSDRKVFIQKLFIGGEVSEEYHFIPVSSDIKSVGVENDVFIRHILTLFDTRDKISRACIKHNINDSDSAVTCCYIINGAIAKALTFNGEIIAIGNLNEDIWIPTVNFKKNIDDIEKFKQYSLKKRMQRDLKLMQDGYIREEKNNEEYESTLDNLVRYLDELTLDLSAYEDDILNN